MQAIKNRIIKQVSKNVQAIKIKLNQPNPQDLNKKIDIIFKKDDVNIIEENRERLFKKIKEKYTENKELEEQRKLLQKQKNVCDSK